MATVSPCKPEVALVYRILACLSAKLTLSTAVHLVPVSETAVSDSISLCPEPHSYKVHLELVHLPLKHYFVPPLSPSDNDVRIEQTPDHHIDNVDVVHEEHSLNASDHVATEHLLGVRDTSLGYAPPSLSVTPLSFLPAEPFNDVTVSIKDSDSGYLEEVTVVSDDSLDAPFPKHVNVCHTTFLSDKVHNPDPGGLEGIHQQYAYCPCLQPHKGVLHT